MRASTAPCNIDPAWELNRVSEHTVTGDWSPLYWKYLILAPVIGLAQLLIQLFVNYNLREG